MTAPLDRLRAPLNASRVHLNNFVRDAAQSLPSGSMVLDAGAGNCPYRTHFAHTTYESADFGQADKRYAPDLTYICDLKTIPVDDHRYDAVIITQVMEHLPEPVDVLRELHRVIKPGGQIWASCPFYYEEHEQPYDFYRYTQFALRRMFDETGFSNIEIGWLEGYWQTVGYQLDLMSWPMPKSMLPIKALLKLASDLCARRDLTHKRTDVGHPKNYTIIATAA